MQLLGFGTTLGIIAQTAALIPFLRKVGFRWRPRFDFRRAEVAETRRMAGPLFGYILTTQVAFLVVQNITNAASDHARYDGFPAYSYAWLLFRLPYAIVGISVITALLPRISAHASEEKYSLVKSDFSGGVRLSSVIVVPAALVLAVLGAPLAEALFGYGGASVAEAHYIGMVFGIFSLGLVPYMMFQLMLRVFYAMHDAHPDVYRCSRDGRRRRRQPLVARRAARRSCGRRRGGGVRAGQRRGHGAVVAHPQPPPARPGRKEIAASLSRMHLAAIPSLLFALAATSMIGVILPPGPAYGIVTVIIGGGGALLLYLLFARALRITEVTELASGLRNRLGR